MLHSSAKRCFDDCFHCKAMSDASINVMFLLFSEMADGVEADGKR